MVFIRLVISPQGFPALFMKNKDGSLHVGVNYRQLGKEMVNNYHPMPHISDLFDHLQGAVVFFGFDLMLCMVGYIVL